MAAKPLSDKPVTIDDLQARKQRGPPIAMLTAYDYTSARLAEAAGVDVLLVGDSLAMTIQGLENTLPVTLDEMIYHTRLVSRGAKRALVATDMPFMSYHVSCEQAVAGAGRCVKEGGARMVKVEGGRRMSDVIEAIVRAQIPVMGHIGLTPQSVHALSGFKVQRAREQLLDDAKAVAEAGASLLVIECVPAAIAGEITAAVRIPTVGIGAGARCDGQVLVFHDALGLTDETEFFPRFLKRYAELGGETRDAIARYVQDVRERKFPGPEHEYK